MICLIARLPYGGISFNKRIEGVDKLRIPIRTREMCQLVKENRPAIGSVGTDCFNERLPLIPRVPPLHDALGFSADEDRFPVKPAAVEELGYRSGNPFRRAYRSFRP